MPGAPLGAGEGSPPIGEPKAFSQTPTLSFPPPCRAHGQTGLTLGVVTRGRHPAGFPSFPIDRPD